MNVWKKVSMLTLVVALAMSFCVMANATVATKAVGDNAGTNNELTNDYNGFDAISFTVGLANNSNLSGKPRPEIAFTYAITPPSGTVPTLSFDSADANGKKTVTFALDNSGADASQTVTVNVSNVSGVVSAIYDYTITQEAVDNGVCTFAAVTKTLKIAVNAGKVTQAVLVDSENAKVAGFTNTYDRLASGAGAIGADVLVMKTVIGPAANTTLDEENAFDLVITLPAGANGHWDGLNITLSQGNSKTLGFGSNTTVTLTGGSASFTSGTIYAIVDPSTSSYTLGSENANALTISGLPEGSTVAVTDKIGDGQQLKAYHNSTGEYSQIVGTDNGYVTTNSSGSYATTATAGANTVKIEYVGLREAISLTGVTLRYAPYLLTLGAGVTVLPLSRRYKKREEDV